MDISEIRCHNTRLLVDSYGTMARFADVMGRAHAQIGHWVGKNPTRNIGSKVAREIEQCTGKPRGWLDVYHVDSAEGLLPHDHQSLQAGRETAVVQPSECSGLTSLGRERNP